MFSRQSIKRVFSRSFSLQRVFLPITLGALGLLLLGFLSKTPLASHILVYVLALCFSLIVVFALRAFQKKGRSADSLRNAFHGRVIRFFASLVSIPIILITSFSILFFYLSLNAWFNSTVQKAIRESKKISSAYLEEHQKVIKHHVTSLKDELQQIFPQIGYSNELLNNFLTLQTRLRSIDECLVFQSNGRVLGRSQFSFGLEFEAISGSVLQYAQQNIAIYPNKNKTRFLAVTQIDPKQGIYLITARKVDPDVLSHIATTNKAGQAYTEILSNRQAYTIQFTILFLIVTSLTLLLTMWRGLSFANSISKPIQNLITAAQKLQKGLFASRCSFPPVHRKVKEIENLVNVFNQMAQEIEEKQADLQKVYAEIQRRHTLTNNVLSGVSSGVLALNSQGHIILANDRASTLLGVLRHNLLSQPLASVCPELWSHFSNEKNLDQDRQITLQRDEQTVVFRVHVQFPKHKSNKSVEPVITFEDITHLLKVQKQAAWADVAKHVAHEIKNPLTPIQLSAERLRRRYLEQITTDQATFETCIHTIQSQVRNVAAIVEEFLSFARLPKPMLVPTNIHTLILDLITLERAAYPDIEWNFEEYALDIPCDASQLSQVFMNLFKNAVESLRDKKVTSPRVQITFEETSDMLFIYVEDNGAGFPEELKNKLTDPYFTTKAEGVGLGLAIVQKIIMDHQGEIIFLKGQYGGAKVCLKLKKHIARAA
jgi:two-component system nitrogen regulation sensor histidine kinase NtrY